MNNILYITIKDKSIHNNKEYIIHEYTLFINSEQTKLIKKHYAKYLINNTNKVSTLNNEGNIKLTIHEVKDKYDAVRKLSNNNKTINDVKNIKPKVDKYRSNKKGKNKSKNKPKLDLKLFTNWSRINLKYISNNTELTGENNYAIESHEYIINYNNKDNDYSNIKEKTEKIINEITNILYLSKNNKTSIKNTDLKLINVIE